MGNMKVLTNTIVGQMMTHLILSFQWQDSHSSTPLILFRGHQRGGCWMSAKESHLPMHRADPHILCLDADCSLFEMCTRQLVHKDHLGGRCHLNKRVQWTVYILSEQGSKCPSSLLDFDEHHIGIWCWWWRSIFSEWLLAFYLMLILSCIWCVVSCLSHTQFSWNGQQWSFNETRLSQHWHLLWSVHPINLMDIIWQ